MVHRWDPTCPRPSRLVRPVRPDPHGLTGPTPGQARGPAWRSTSRGWYVPADTPADLPEQRIIEQAVRLPDDGAITGWAALRLHGARFFDGLAPDGSSRIAVPLAVGPSSKIRGDDRVRPSREPLPPEAVVIRQGVPCTEVRRALFDEMRRRRDVREAVVAMDMAAAALLVSVRQMQEFWAAHRSWRRATLAGDALRLASEHSRSPQESRLRLVWTLDARLPAPRVNQPIWDRDGRLLGIADLLDVEAGLVGEFDGADHRAAARHTSDLARQERLERCGLVVARFTGIDLLDPATVAARIRFQRGRAQFLPPTERAWTVTPPQGWRGTQSLDEYLAEEAVLRELRHGPV